MSDETRFRPVQKRRVAEYVAEQIRDQILSGAFAAGRRLPPERQLAQAFGVNRTTVREALRALEQERLLNIHHGEGATVLDAKLHAGLELLTHLIYVDGKPDLALVADIFEARRAFGLELARLATLRAQPEEIEALESVVEELALHVGDAPKFQELDWRFFETLAKAARNRVFALVLNTLRPIYLEQRELFSFIYGDCAAIVSLHRRLVKELRQRNADGAVETLSRFLDLALSNFGELESGTSGSDFPRRNKQ